MSFGKSVKKETKDALRQAIKGVSIETVEFKNEISRQVSRTGDSPIDEAIVHGAQGKTKSPQDNRPSEGVVTLDYLDKEIEKVRRQKKLLQADQGDLSSEPPKPKKGLFTVKGRKRGPGIGQNKGPEQYKKKG